jgi:hypothetical protein
MIKKISLVYAICILLCSHLNAQKTNKEYKWAAGVDIGNIFIRGDVNSIKTQFCEGVHLYKPFAKWFALKVNFIHGNAKGLNYKASENFAKNPAWSSKYAAPYRLSNGTLAFGYVTNNVFTPTSTHDLVYYNYKTVINSLSISAAFTLPIPIRSSNPKFGIHFNYGAGLLSYKTKVDVLNTNGTNYVTLFNDVFTANSGATETLKKLKNGMDNVYETDAETLNNSPRFTQNLSLGFSYKINDRFVIGIERSGSFLKDDLLDGQRWQEQAFGDAVITRDFDYLIYNSLNLSYQF